jgi:Uncharacterised protein family (UPF0175)
MSRAHNESKKLTYYASPDRHKELYRIFELQGTIVLWQSRLQFVHTQAMQVTVEIPDQFVEHLVPAGRDAARSLLEESVAGAYRDGRLTMEQVRQLLGFGTRMQVDAFLQQHEVYDYTVEDLDKDMATLDRVLTTNSR